MKTGKIFEKLVYIPDDASKLVWEMISLKLKKKIGKRNFQKIICALIEYYAKIGLFDFNNKKNNLDLSINIEDDILLYMLKKLQDEEIYLTITEVREILDAEYEYLMIIGAFEENSVHLN